jgi:hypothetical protein
MRRSSCTRAASREQPNKVLRFQMRDRVVRVLLQMPQDCVPLARLAVHLLGLVGLG